MIVPGGQVVISSLGHLFSDGKRLTRESSWVGDHASATNPGMTTRQGDYNHT